MWVRTTLSVVFVMFIIAVSPLQAQYVEIYRLDNLAKDRAEQDVLSTVATHLAVPADTLKQQKAEYKISVGELYIAHQLAKQAKLDFKSIMDEFRGGKAWGVIAKERNINMDQVSKDARQLEDALKKTQRASK
jgi:hypothetical protein